MWKIFSQGHILSTITNVFWRYIFQELLFSPHFLNQLFPFIWKFPCMPMPIVFFSGFSTHGSHNHFVGITYTTRGPIGRNIVCSSLPLHSSPYINNPPYLCFPFVGGWYTYGRSHIRCGSFFLRLQHEFLALRLLM
jgi:hypothetical protein